MAFDLTGTAAQPLALLCSEVIQISGVIVFTQKEYLPKKNDKVQEQVCLSRLERTTVLLLDQVTSPSQRLFPWPVQPCVVIQTRGLTFLFYHTTHCVDIAYLQYHVIPTTQREGQVEPQLVLLLCVQ